MTQPEPQTSSERHAQVAKAWSTGAVAFVIGLVAAPLPDRWRRRVPLLDSSAWEEAAIPSALVQMLGGLALFAMSYLAWLNGQLTAIDAGSTTVTAASGSTMTADEQQIVGRVLLMGNPILPLIYAFTTLSGFALLVTWLSGGIRLVHDAITKEPMPDPVLGLVDFAILEAQGKARRELRERSKDTSPDRLILGTKSDGYAMVIETSKDLDWREGNTIIVSSTWYRLKSRSEEAMPAGLRLRYVLEEMPVGVAIRGVRKYEPGHAPVIVSSQD